MLTRCHFCKKLIFRGEASSVEKRNHRGDPTSHAHATCAGKQSAVDVIRRVREIRANPPKEPTNV